MRREIQKALVEEHAARGVTQASIASELGVNRSVIHRQIVGYENMTIGRAGEISDVLGRVPVFRLVKPEECSNYFVTTQTTQVTVTPVQSATPQNAASMTTSQLLQQSIIAQTVAAT